MAGRNSREADQDVCLYLDINHAVQRKRFGGTTLYNCRHGKRSSSRNKHTSLHPAINSPGLFLPHFKLKVRLQTKPKYITARTGEFVFAWGSVAVHGGGEMWQPCSAAATGFWFRFVFRHNNTKQANNAHLILKAFFPNRIWIADSAAGPCFDYVLVSCQIYYKVSYHRINT